MTAMEKLPTRADYERRKKLMKTLCEKLDPWIAAKKAAKIRPDKCRYVPKNFVDQLLCLIFWERSPNVREIKGWAVRDWAGNITYVYEDKSIETEISGVYYNRFTRKPISAVKKYVVFSLKPRKARKFPVQFLQLLEFLDLVLDIDSSA